MKWTEASRTDPCTGSKTCVQQVRIISRYAEAGKTTRSSTTWSAMRASAPEHGVIKVWPSRCARRIFWASGCGAARHAKDRRANLGQESARIVLVARNQSGTASEWNARLLDRAVDKDRHIWGAAPNQKKLKSSFTSFKPLLGG
eukprot:scaffold2790_cov122-Isochrysis_galbana.AAC.1